MRALVTGGTGKVGSAIVDALVERGDDVVALARDPAHAATVLPAGVAAVRGDVGDRDSLLAAARGCELVFNAMGLPEQWRADDRDFERVNAEGSRAVVRAARESGVRRVVHVSTIDVFDAAAGQRFDESRVADYPKGTAYERSKQRAEELALGERGEMELVIINPAAVYGPGPAASVGLAEDLIQPILRRRLPALPPGGVGVVFAPGVARGALLAAERGRDGERYILCDQFVSLRELAQSAVRVAGRGLVPPTLPVALARPLASLSELLAGVSGRPPMLARGQLQFFLWNAVPDSTRAQESLGWEPTALDDGLRATLVG